MTEEKIRYERFVGNSEGIKFLNKSDSKEPDEKLSKNAKRKLKYPKKKTPKKH